MRNPRGNREQVEAAALPIRLGASFPAPSLVMTQNTAQTSDELEIIDELIKEDGFQPETTSLLPRASPNGTARLVPRGCSPASSPGTQRLADPMATGPLSHGMPPFGVSHPAAPHASPLHSPPSHLSQSLSSLTLTPRVMPRTTVGGRHPQVPWPPPMRPPRPTVHKNELEDIMLEPPRLVITEQPKQRGMRFRYECEGRSAGSILGERSTEANKTLPSIELLNLKESSEVKVIACLVWKDWPHRIHPHSLVGKDCNEGLCEVTLKPQSNPKHSFNNLGIQCVKKKEIETAIDKKLQLGIDPFKAGSLKNHQEVDMNVVRICFQASYQDSTGQTRHLSPVLSEPIYDKKSTNTSELKICRMNKEYGSCTGGEELYLLCDKVQKEDISIIFRKDSWEGKADFSQTDVHRQIAIVFKTPPYQHLDITEPVEVKVYLRRLTDSVCSDAFSFLYLPKDPDKYGVNVKRKRGMPDVLEELSGSDPHGIEAKRRKKKPDYVDHLPPPQTPAGAFAHPEDMPCLPSLGNVMFLDTFEDYSLLCQDYTPYNFPSLSDVVTASGPAMDFPDAAQQEFLLEPCPLHPDAPSASFLLPGEDDAEGMASLVGNNMFPGQYHETKLVLGDVTKPV